MEIEKLQQQGIDKFEQLKKSVEEQVLILSQLNIIDETSLAIANQQLSKAKQLTNIAEEARVEIKAPALEFGKQIDKLAKDLVGPLNLEVDNTKSKMLNYNKAEQAKKQADLARVAAEQQKALADQLAAQKAEDEKTLKLQKQIIDFEVKAFHAINSSLILAELSSAYTVFVLAFPPEYGDIVKDRIKALGIAKKKVLDTINPFSIISDAVKQEALDNYNKVYSSITGVTVKVEAKTIEVPSFQVEASKQAELAVATPVINNIRKSWAWELERIEDVPAEWLTIDEDQIKAFMKSDKETIVDGMVYNGIKFFYKETIVIK